MYLFTLPNTPDWSSYISQLKELDESIHIKALSLWWLFQKNFNNLLSR